MTLQEAVLKINKELFENLYHDVNLTSDDIAQKLGISKTLYSKLVNYWHLQKSSEEISARKKLATKKCNYRESCAKRAITNQERYGCTNPRIVLHPESYSYSYYKSENFRKKIIFQNIKFDSSWEFYYYIYVLDNNKSITRYSGSGLDYTDNAGKRHKYFPDFVVNNELVEIKGAQFLDSNLSLIDPYGSDPSAKDNCMRINNVRLVSPISMKYIITIVEQKYGKDYYKKFINK